MFKWFRKKEVKFCKDCKHYSREASFNICKHPKLITNITNIITGEKITHKASCQQEREYYSLFYDCCGKRAKYFEPKGGNDEL